LTARAPDNDDPEANCVQWRSGGVGGQTTTATFAGTGEIVAGTMPTRILNGIGDPPLIKRWNDIDFTSIVGATGNVDTRSSATPASSNWGGTDASTRFCARANLTARH
jgi:hypothetical protein